MGSFLESQLKQYGVETKLVDLGSHKMDGQTLKLPPVLLGRIGNDNSKKTILIYGHFDVQPVRLPPRSQYPLETFIVL
jgi:Cys-Gly metallodipeptidase DUG1